MGYKLIHNVVLFSGSKVIQLCIQNHSFPDCSPCRLLQNIEWSSHCCTVGPCWLCILCIVVYNINHKLPVKSSPSSFPSGNQKLAFEVWVCFCLINKFVVSPFYMLYVRHIMCYLSLSDFVLNIFDGVIFKTQNIFVEKKLKSLP